MGPLIRLKGDSQSVPEAQVGLVYLCSTHQLYAVYLQTPQKPALLNSPHHIPRQAIQHINAQAFQEVGASNGGSLCETHWHQAWRLRKRRCSSVPLWTKAGRVRLWCRQQGPYRGAESTLYRDVGSTMMIPKRPRREPMPALGSGDPCCNFQNIRALIVVGFLLPRHPQKGHRFLETAKWVRGCHEGE